MVFRVMVLFASIVGVLFIVPASRLKMLSFRAGEVERAKWF